MPLTTTRARPSPAAHALAAILSSDDVADAAIAQQIRARVHRTALWRYLHGRRDPDLTTATFLDRVSGGRIAATRWIVGARAA